MGRKLQLQPELTILAQTTQEMRAIRQINNIRRSFKELYDGLPLLIGGKAVTFFKDGFRRQGWVENGSLQRWKQRAPGARRNAGRNLLMDTGRLRRSIRITAHGRGFVKIGTDVPYAQAHNEGASIHKRVRVASHRRTGRNGMYKVNTHMRQVDTEIPQRKFIGESPDVIKSVEREIIRKLEAIISNSK